jgi:hypothetical protein
MRAFLPVVLLVAGCGANSIEDGCKNHIAGQSGSAPEELEIFSRITCYRKYVGLDQARIVTNITEAAESHAYYLEQNEVLTVDPYSWPYESPSGVGFTGEDSFARLDASQYFVETTATAFVWEVLLLVEEDFSYEELIDEYMIDPFFRDAFLAPSWEGGGYAEGTDPTWGRFGYMNIVLYFPSGSRTTRPVVYPQDGQEDVPTTWVRTFEDAAIQLPSEVGFPISFTAGSARITSGINPLEVQVKHSTITGPDGEVEHQVLLPGYYAGGVNWSTAILVPVEPLQPDSTYTVEAELSWIDQQSRKEELTFTTAADPA